LLLPHHHYLSHLAGLLVLVDLSRLLHQAGLLGLEYLELLSHRRGQLHQAGLLGLEAQLNQLILAVQLRP
jgi:hypothetical protein